MKIITYSLRAGENSSDNFYLTLSNFADEFEERASKAFGSLVGDFQNWLKDECITPLEHYLDLLMIGVLMKVYGKELDRELLRPPLKLLRKLIGSLRRTEKREEGRRVQQWLRYLSAAELNRRRQFFEKVAKFAKEFEEWSKRVLGKYTPNVEAFLASMDNKGRDDALLRSRKRVEYHLNMLSAEVLNRSFREDFLRTDKRILILPQCMRAQPDEKCKATPTPFGSLCAFCTDGCSVHRVTRIMKEHGIETYLSGELVVALSEGKKLSKGFGVVGVSCPLTLISEGRKAKALKVAAQGVLLDYCGCKYHWDDVGIITSFNMKKLKEILCLP